MFYIYFPDTLHVGVTTLHINFDIDYQMAIELLSNFDAACVFVLPESPPADAIL